MTDTTATRTRYREISRRRLRPFMMTGCATLLLAAGSLAAFIDTARAQDTPREQYIPVFGVTMEEKPAGIVIYVMVLLAERGAAEGLVVQVRMIATPRPHRQAG